MPPLPAKENLGSVEGAYRKALIPGLADQSYIYVCYGLREGPRAFLCPTRGCWPARDAVLERAVCSVRRIPSYFSHALLQSPLQTRLIISTSNNCSVSLLDLRELLLRFRTTTKHSRGFVKQYVSMLADTTQYFSGWPFGVSQR